MLQAPVVEAHHLRASAQRASAQRVSSRNRRGFRKRGRMRTKKAGQKRLDRRGWLAAGSSLFKAAAAESGRALVRSGARSRVRSRASFLGSRRPVLMAPSTHSRTSAAHSPPAYFSTCREREIEQFGGKSNELLELGKAIVRIGQAAGGQGCGKAVRDLAPSC